MNCADCFVTPVEPEGGYCQCRDYMSGLLVDKGICCTCDKPIKTFFSHKPGCPVLSAAGNPQCTCNAVRTE